MKSGTKPILSVVVVFHNMTREAERTLHTLSSIYQLGIHDRNYEIIAIDNGSEHPLDSKCVRAFGPNFKYHFYQTDSVSPVAAINFGAQEANGEYLALIVDGARMITPGLIGETLRAVKVFDNSFVCCLGWHLGPGVQNETMLAGYDQIEEDRLLTGINWKQNGYGLFDISSLAQSSSVGFLGGMPAECSWFAMSRKGFVDMGGYDSRFQSPGGGLVNHDFLERLLADGEFSPIVILGEGSFHQFHGGVATNVPMVQHPINSYAREYREIHGKNYPRYSSTVSPYYMGKMPAAAFKFVS